MHTQIFVSIDYVMRIAMRFNLTLSDEQALILQEKAKNTDMENLDLIRNILENDLSKYKPMSFSLSTNRFKRLKLKGLSGYIADKPTLVCDKDNIVSVIECCKVKKYFGITREPVSVIQMNKLLLDFLFNIEYSDKNDKKIFSLYSTKSEYFYALFLNENMSYVVISKYINYDDDDMFEKVISNASDAAVVPNNLMYLFDETS